MPKMTEERLSAMQAEARKRFAWYHGDRPTAPVIEMPKPLTIFDKGFIGVIRSIEPLGPVKTPRKLRPKKEKVAEDFKEVFRRVNITFKKGQIPKEGRYRTKALGTSVYYPQQPRRVKPLPTVDFTKLAAIARKTPDRHVGRPKKDAEVPVGDRTGNIKRPPAEYSNRSPYGIASEMLLEQMKKKTG